MTPREELIEIQRRMVRDLKREIYDSLYGNSTRLQRYAKSYGKHFTTPGEITDREVFLERAAASDVVYHGDFHTLKLSQLSPIKILRALEDRGRRVCLALEMFCARDQAVLDRFARLEITEEEFLEAIAYEETWGFDWNNYRNLVYFALGRGIPVLALDCRDTAEDVSIEARDDFAGRRIAERLESHPDELVYVFCGELHLAPDHLPESVDRAVADPEPPKRTILYQNNEDLYWMLAEQELEHDASLVQLDDDQFCLMNSTPLVVYQSYRNWAEHQEELAQAADGWWDGTGNTFDYTDQVHQLVRIVADFLDIRCADLDDFTVVSAEDFDFLDRLSSRYRLSDERIREILDEVEHRKSFIVPEASLIYLSNISMNRAAEEASRYVHFRLAGFGGTPSDPREAFYTAVMNRAVGFFGSKIVNHKRTAKRESYYRKIETRNRRRRLGEKEAGFLRLARFVLQHKELERRVLEPGRRLSWPKNIYRLEPELVGGVTGALGNLLGDRIYAGMITGDLAKAEIRELFARRFEDGTTARDTYFDLCRRIAPLEADPDGLALPPTGAAS